jgi:hypothetical protein
LPYRANVWDDWEPVSDVFDLSISENSASLVQPTLPNLAFINAVEEPYLTVYVFYLIVMIVIFSLLDALQKKQIGIASPIPIVDNHPAEIDVSNVQVKLSNQER